MKLLLKEIRNRYVQENFKRIQRELDSVLGSGGTTLLTKTVNQVIQQQASSNANIVIYGVPCESTVFEGAAVRMLASGVAKNAIADSAENSNILGVVESKPTTTTCDIRVSGVSAEIFSSLDVTKEYYLSDTIAGSITTTPPTTSGHVTLRVGQPYSSTKLLVMKGTRTVRG